jgi:hypothetical protein
MFAGTLDDTGAPTIEVRVYRNGRPPGDAPATEEPLAGGDEDQPLASRQLPGYGTE